MGGRIVAGRLVRLACERHLRDMKEGPARGLHWDAKAAKRAIGFFGFLHLPVEGELDGKAFVLEPFQAFIVGSVFGWKNADGSRRFRTSYTEAGKGCGKSPLAAGVGLFGLVADDEAAAEVYSAAVTTLQANILFQDARRMAESSPDLRDELDIGRHNIAYPATDSFFRPVSGEHSQQSGPRPHMALIDEIHEHPNPLMVDKMRAGTKGRKQALVFEITNSGFDRTTVCWHHHEYSVKVLEGLIENDSWFAYVCQLDPCEACRQEGQTQPKEGCPDCDDWRDESVWLKANPGLDTILPRKYLREQVAEAIGMPTKEGIVKRLNFCIWTEAATKAIPLDAWDACGSRAIDLALLVRRDVYLGLDIGATSDFTALVLLFPHDDAETIDIPADPAKPEGDKIKVTRRSYTFLEEFWLPRHPVRRDPHMQEVIEAWRLGKKLRTTEGDVVDYDLVMQHLIELTAPYNVVEIAFDRGFQGVHMEQLLLAKFGEKKVWNFAQGILSMAPPFRELLELLKTKRLHHGNHPIMRWMAGNAAAVSKGGLSKPSKEHSSEKIDGITALVMALGRAMLRKTVAWYKPGLLRN